MPMGEEDQLCITLNHFFILKYRAYAGMFLHIPNGGKRNIREAAKFKKMGVMAGVPDYFLPVPKGKYHGFWLEVKTTKGRLSTSQKDMLALLEGQGYYCAVGYGLNQCIELLDRYLGQDDGR